MFFIPFYSMRRLARQRDAVFMVIDPEGKIWYQLL